MMRQREALTAPQRGAASVTYRVDPCREGFITAGASTQTSRRKVRAVT